jgi:hypothetical protein
MARSASIQFQILSPDEAHIKLVGMTFSGEVGDRIALQRQIWPVASVEEISNNEAYMHAKGLFGPWRFYLVNQGITRHVEPRRLQQSDAPRNYNRPRMEPEPIAIERTANDPRCDWFRSEDWTDKGRNDTGVSGRYRKNSPF